MNLAFTNSEEMSMLAHASSWTCLRGSLGFPKGLSSKESACSAGATGDEGLIPGLEKSPGGGNSNPL